MPNKKRCLMIGAGGMGGGWIRQFFPNFSDRSEIVGLVDIDERVLHEHADSLGLSAEARFTDFKKAFAAVDANYCTIVTPPWVHRPCIEAACRRGMHILSEKPIADSWKDVVASYRAVKRAGVKCTLTQNYRYNASMYTFREVLRSGRLGRLNYIMGRFQADYRGYPAWSAFRHEIPHAFLVEGGIHHFDMLRNLAGSHCVEISGCEWDPRWSSFKGESSASFVMKMANGVVAHYECDCNAAGHQNNWHQEYYRASCEKGDVVVDNDQVVRIVSHDMKTKATTIEEVPAVRREFEGHNHVIDAHLKWISGGAKPETTIDDNIRSNAIVFAAIDASARGKTVNVEAMVAKAMS